MAHPLQHQIAVIRRRVRNMVVIYGASWILALVAVAVVLLGFVDYLVRFQDPGIRIICTLLVLALGALATYNYLVLPFSRRLRDVDLAQRIERHFPQLNERLSSAIEFLKQPVDDPQAGSAELRRAVITQTADEVEGLNLGESLDYRPPLAALAAAAGTLVVVAVLAILDPTSVRIALARLANPVSSVAWPKQNALVFKRSPTRLALGKPFEIELIDRNDRMPRDVKIHYRRTVDGANVESHEAMQFVGGNMVARVDNVTQPFEYRATGGDDHSMAWTRLDVVEPPSIESFEVTLHPPAYTGLPAVKSEKRIRALRGTRVAMTGTATKPLTEAALLLDSGEQIAARLSEEGHRFTVNAADFEVDKSGAYWFALEDAEQLTGGEDTRWEIRAVTDTPPTVAIEQPASNIFVTPAAVVNLRVLAKDNLAVREIVLRYSRTDKSGEGDFEIKLYQGPERVVPTGRATSESDSESGESRLAELSWNLAELGLSPGVHLSLVAYAADYLPQEGQSTGVRRITVISPMELEDRLSQQQAAILAELARVLKLEREARSQVATLETQVGEIRALGKSDIDSLQAAELHQRQVDRSLGDAPDAVPAHIVALLRDLESNQVDSPEIERRMTGLLGELEHLNREFLPAIGRELTAALKSAQAQLASRADRPDATSEPPVEAPAPHSADVRNSLAAAGDGQDQVIQTLERLLGDLSEWSDYRRFAREMRQIQQDQDDVSKATGNLGTLTEDLKDLTSQQRAELKKVAQGQFELARRLDKLLQGMDEMSGELGSKDPLAAATLQDALHLARQSAITGQMRQSGEHVERNQVGQATDVQTEIAAALREVLDLLANRREHELGRLVGKLREAEKDLARLAKEQQGLQKKLKDAAQTADPQERQRELQRLTRQQQNLQEELERMARQLKRLQAEKAGRSTERAAAQTGQAGEAGADGDGQQAEEHAAKAKKDLDDAQQQLAEARRQAEADLAREQLARFEDAIRGLVSRQQQILDRTIEQEEVKQTQAARARAAALQDLGRLQDMLREETALHGQNITEAESFRVALAGAAAEMGQAAQWLRQRETGQPAQRAERNALARLELLLKAFGEDDVQAKPGDEQQGGSGEGGSGGQRMRNLAELKLLKLLQEDVNRRTLELDEQTTAEGAASDEQVEEYARLSEEQGKLADLVFDLLQPDSTASEQDTPENLPDVRSPAPSDDDLPPLNLEGN